MEDFCGIPVRVIKSARKTLSVSVDAQGILVRVPKRTANIEIDLFLRRHAGWIERQWAKEKAAGERAQSAGILTKAQIERLKKAAKPVFEARAEYFAPQVGVGFGKITVRCQKTRWGSCSSKKNLNFNCLLLLAPPEVLDAVVVHELCHIKEMNHSKRFYDLVLRVMPDYAQRDRWLKTNGKALAARAPE